MSTTAKLEDARAVVHPNFAGSTGWAATVVAAMEQTATIVPLGDHPALMVARGDADAAVLLGGAPWDHAALTVIVEEAGGTFTDHLGGSRVDIGGAIFSNSALDDELIARCVV